MWPDLNLNYLLIWGFKHLWIEPEMSEVYVFVCLFVIILTVVFPIVGIIWVWEVSWIIFVRQVTFPELCWQMWWTLVFSFCLAATFKDFSFAALLRLTESSCNGCIHTLILVDVRQFFVILLVVVWVLIWVFLYWLWSETSWLLRLSLHGKSYQLAQIDIEDHEKVDQLYAVLVDRQPKCSKQVELELFLPLLLALPYFHDLHAIGLLLEECHLEPLWVDILHRDHVLHKLVLLHAGMDRIVD